MTDKDTKTVTVPSVPEDHGIKASQAEPRETKGTDKDIGEWEFIPWSGLARWVHKTTRQESYDPEYVKAHK